MCRLLKVFDQGSEKWKNTYFGHHSKPPFICKINARFDEIKLLKRVFKTLEHIAYHYSKSHLPIFLKFTERYISLSQVNNPREALKQYDTLGDEISKLHNFMNALRDQLVKTYFSRANIHLLTLPSELFKRHAIRNLYSS